VPTDWLEARCCCDDAAQEAPSLPLLRLLLAADALDAPLAASWAAAVAAARALKREGGCADDNVDAAASAAAKCAVSAADRHT
jgi:hypothetical protein